MGPELSGSRDALSLNRSGLIWPVVGRWLGSVTNVEFGEGSHANWILVPGDRLLNCDWTWTRRWQSNRANGEEVQPATTLMAGSFVATDEIARWYTAYHLRIRCLRIVECEIERWYAIVYTMRDRCLFFSLMTSLILRGGLRGYVSLIFIQKLKTKKNSKRVVWRDVEISVSFIFVFFF